MLWRVELTQITIIVIKVWVYNHFDLTIEIVEIEPGNSWDIVFILYILIWLLWYFTNWIVLITVDIWICQFAYAISRIIEMWLLNYCMRLKLCWIIVCSWVTLNYVESVYAIEFRWIVLCGGVRWNIRWTLWIGTVIVSDKSHCESESDLKLN